MSNTWFKREGMRQVIFRLGENETEVDFVLIKKEHRLFLLNVKAILGELKHALMVADIDKKKVRVVVRKTKGNGISNCSCHRAVKLLEHGAKGVRKKVL